MADLHMCTHKYLLQAWSQKAHLAKVLLWRFWKFSQRIMKSNKVDFANLISKDTRSQFGDNLRRLMILTRRQTIEQMTDEDIRNIITHPVPQEEFWRVDISRELQRIKSNDLRVDGFDSQEVNELLVYICFS